MTGITKDELMQMARESGLEFCEEESAHSVYVSLAQFTNAILERAAVEIDNHGQDLCHGDRDMQKYRERSKSTRALYAGVVRALKINTGD